MPLNSVDNNSCIRKQCEIKPTHIDRSRHFPCDVASAAVFCYFARELDFHIRLRSRYHLVLESITDSRQHIHLLVV